MLNVYAIPICFCVDTRVKDKNGKLPLHYLCEYTSNAELFDVLVGKKT